MSNHTFPAVVKTDVASLDELGNRIRTAHAGVVSVFSSAIGKALGASKAQAAVDFLRGLALRESTPQAAE